jgi:hypothetical protein
METIYLLYNFGPRFNTSMFAQTSDIMVVSLDISYEVEATSDGGLL